MLRRLLTWLNTTRPLGDSLASIGIISAAVFVLALVAWLLLR